MSTEQKQTKTKEIQEKEIEEIFYVYILRCKRLDRTEQFYTGQTNDITRRVQEHKSGKNKSTKSFALIDLEYFKTFKTRKEAMAYEKKVKKFSREEKQKLIDDFSENTTTSL